jgi:acyl-CoA reductase-like NAD-dependent aldehyde dehydrogenase
LSSTYDVINPANETVVKQITEATIEETDAIIAKAHKVFQSWKNVTPYDRSNLLRAFSNKVREHREELAQIEINNAGHTRGNALWEADNVANVLNYYAGVPERL